MSDTCLACRSRLARKVAGRNHLVLCEFDGWITPIEMTSCRHMGNEVRKKRTAEPWGDDEELPDGERML